MVLLLIALLIASIGIWYYVNKSKPDNVINASPTSPAPSTPTVIDTGVNDTNSIEESVGRSGTDQQS